MDTPVRLHELRLQVSTFVLLAVLVVGVCRQEGIRNAAVLQPPQVFQCQLYFLAFLGGFQDKPRISPQQLLDVFLEELLRTYGLSLS